MADDPYDFENDDYEESSMPNFEPSFMLNFERTDEEQATQIFGESDDEEFTGFTYWPMSPQNHPVIVLTDNNFC